MASVAELVSVIDNVLDSAEDTIALLSEANQRAEAVRGGLMLVAEGAQPLEAALVIANDAAEKITEGMAGIQEARDKAARYRALLIGSIE